MSSLKHPELRIIPTADGSLTLLNPDFGETYHSVHGAVGESRHVFIQNGFDQVVNTRSEISILEVGFGTGLNAILTRNEAKKNNVHVHYCSFDVYPLPENVWRNIGYNLSDENIFDLIHLAPWNIVSVIDEHFSLEKRNEPILQLEQVDQNDLIYYDAFGPRVQPEMWTPEIFRKLFEALIPGGILVTYCAKGQVRRDLESAGFVVERLKGPPGKREMIRAKK